MHNTIEPSFMTLRQYFIDDDNGGADNDDERADNNGDERDDNGDEC